MKKIGLLFSILILASHLAWGQILTFEFSALAGNEATANSNSNDVNLTSSTISRGVGLTAAANAERFNATNWALTSIDNAVSGNNYMEFTITPNSGYQFNVSSIYLQLQRSATGPSGIALRSSVDGYSSNLDLERSITDNTSTQNFTFTFSQSNSSSAVTYRIYMWAEATGGSGGIGDGTGNDLVVNGTTTLVGGVADPSSFLATTTSASQINLSWIQNGNSDNVMVAWNSINTFGTPSGSYSVSDPITGGGTVIYNGNGTSYNHTGLTSNTPYYYKAWSVDGSVVYSSGVISNATTLKEEPTNHATSFSSALGTPDYSAIDLTWIDATVGTLPDGYLIKASNVGYGSITDPVDGTPESDDLLIKNIAQGLEAASFTSLNGGTTYYFKIYPYSNTGSNINYKIDVGVPQDDITTNAAPTLPNLLFSEYVEGSSNNKAIEIVNLSGSLVNLGTDNYVVMIYSNGSTTPSSTINLSGSIADGDVSVLVYTLADAPLLAYADQTSGSLTFNGDDAIVLKKGGSAGDVLDIIGQIGFDPGSEWGTGLTSTADNTLRRKGTVTIGDRDGSNAFDPATEWDGFATDTFTGLGDPSPLPVELTSFSATTLGSIVKLSWRTETEINNYGFEVERASLLASPLLVWEKIGFVNGNGNSNSPKSYTFEDKNVTAGRYSYRLKQIDNDGQFEYSKTIEVDFGAPKKFELSQNYPNPFNPVTTIRFNLPEAGNVKLTLFNILGQEIKTLVNEFKGSGVHTINFDASELNSGMYLYKIEAGSFVQTRKMTLVK